MKHLIRKLTPQQEWEEKIEIKRLIKCNSRSLLMINVTNQNTQRENRLTESKVELCNIHIKFNTTKLFSRKRQKIFIMCTFTLKGSRDDTDYNRPIALNENLWSSHNDKMACSRERHNSSKYLCIQQQNT